MLSPMASSPVIGKSFAGDKVPDGSQQEVEGAGCEGISVNEAVDSHAVEVPMHEDRENGGAGEKVEDEGVSVELEGIPKVVDSVGPGLFSNVNSSVNLGFNCSGDSSNRISRRPTLGFKARKSKAQGSKEASPVSPRPRKRPRGSDENVEVGFGFVGFTSRPHNLSEVQSKSDEGDKGGFDLNTRGESSDENDERLGSKDPGFLKTP
ncbi:hypothetical protein Hanom_Chr01g00028231 [Helianthus anomalus]